MITCSPETAIKNIFERAVKSLSDSRDQLYKTRRILKKAVFRLASASNSDDDEVNDVLQDIKDSANENINLEILDSQLDKLSVLTINSDNQQKITVETEFYSSLKRSLDEINCSETCKSIVNTLVRKKLSDKEISLEILKLIDDATKDDLKKTG